MHFVAYECRSTLRLNGSYVSLRWDRRNVKNNEIALRVDLNSQAA